MVRSTAALVSGAISATGRPATVTMVRCPASARRTVAAALARSSRMPIRSMERERTHVCARRVASPPTGEQDRRMNFAFTEEQEELRKTVRAFLDSKSAEAAVREQMETDTGFEPAVWSQMGEQLGLQGLVVPEEFGGSGYTYVELGIVLEEMGR